MCQARPSGCRGGNREGVNLPWNINGSVRSAGDELSSNLPLLTRRTPAGAQAPRETEDQRAEAAGRSWCPSQQGWAAGSQLRRCPGRPPEPQGPSHLSHTTTYSPTHPPQLCPPPFLPLPPGSSPVVMLSFTPRCPPRGLCLSPRLAALPVIG